MTINKYTGKTKEEAINSAKEDLGASVVIMNVREIRPGGIFGIFKKSTYEVTAAIEDDYKSEDTKAPYTVDMKKKETMSPNFSAVADEKIDLSAPAPEQVKGNSAIDLYKKQSSPKKQEESPAIDADELKSVFDEVSKVIESPSGRASETKAKPEKAPDKKKEFIPLNPEAAVAHHEPAVPKTEETPKKNEAASVNEYSSRGSGEYLGFTRMLYNTLVDHEVDERYINPLLNDMDQMIAAGNSMDYLISNVYQKMVLKTGQPQQITLNTDGNPTVVFLVGPTGVGKTTTLAKLASTYKISQHKKVAFFTSDTYRIGAAQQLSVYADILDVSSTVLMTPEDIVPSLSKNKENDIIFIDTVGFSHTNEKQRDSLSKLLSLVPEKYKAQVYLVLSATTKYNDLKKIVDAYKEFTDFSLLFTKLDETANYGNLYNIRQYSGKRLSYITNGQNVPEDFDVLDPQKLVRNLLGGN